MYAVPLIRLPAALRVLAVAATAAVVLALLPALASAQQQDEQRVTPARVEGQTRFHTAANLATLTFDQATVAHIVFAGDFPDALAASYGAGVTGGPILPVPHDEVGENSPTMRALEELGVQRVVLVGGEAAISESVEQELARHGYETERIEGVNRYQTASSVAMHYGTRGEIGTLAGDRTALLASGDTFADALAAGPVAANAHFPLFLTPSDSTEASVNHSLEQLGIERVVVVGGQAAVSSSVVEYYQQQGYEVERWSGATRTATAATVADNAVQRLGFDAALTLLARGDDFADALAASVHGGVNAAPLLLTANPTTLSEPTREWFTAACPDVDAVRAIGGTAAVSDAALAEAVDAAEACRRSRTGQTFGVAPQEPVTHEPGTPHEFSVFARYDDQPFTGPVDIALFPCDNVAATASPVHFTDADGNGSADGLGDSDTGSARIVTLNGTATDTTVVRDATPGDDDLLRFDLNSRTADCTVPVVFDDVDDDGQLAVDGSGHATEPFGVGQIRWE